MEGLVAVAALITAIASLAAAGSAVWLAFLNRQLVLASQEQVKASQAQVEASQAQVKISQDEVRASQEQVAVSQEQVRLGQEQLNAQRRPILVPNGDPAFQEDHDNWLDWQWRQQGFSFSNLGTGSAFNIAAVLYGCASYQYEDAGLMRRMRETADQHWTLWLGEPIAPGQSTGAVLTPGGSVFLAGNDRIGDYPFNAPDEELPRFTSNPDALWRVARLTITYHDIAGRKFESVFDYIHNSGWYKVALLPVEYDLRDLEGMNRPIVEQDAKQAALKSADQARA
jgi:hypothetical protein